MRGKGPLKLDWDSLFERYGDLSLGRRRLLCLLLWLACISSAVMLLLEVRWWVLPSLVTIALSVAAYVPLDAYLERMDHYRFGTWLSYSERHIDPHKEAGLIRNTYDQVRWIMGAGIVSIFLYMMLASTLTLWTPQTTQEWGIIMVAMFWLVVYTTPTVVACWIHDDRYKRESSVFEDED